MHGHNISCAEINERNRAFWDAQDQAMQRRLADPDIRESAFETLALERRRSIPAYSQSTLESALAKAEDSIGKIRLAATAALGALGRKGGRAKHQDQLQDFVDEVVARNPQTTERELRAKIENRKHNGVIEDIDEDGIHFKASNGQLKVATHTGLKDRLSRAKKKFSRKYR